MKSLLHHHITAMLDSDSDKKEMLRQWYIVDLESYPPDLITDEERQEINALLHSPSR